MLNIALTTMPVLVIHVELTKILVRIVQILLPHHPITHAAVLLDFKITPLLVTVVPHGMAMQLPVRRLLHVLIAWQMISAGHLHTFVHFVRTLTVHRPTVVLILVVTIALITHVLLKLGLA